MASERLQNTSRNVFHSAVNMLSQIVLGLVARAVFVYTLGKAYQGVSGLFGNILGVLSISELGIGAAIGFSLYRPLAQNDVEKIKSLMRLYRRAYWLIGCFVAVAGTALIPFLPYIINNTTHLPHITFYYCLFLFDAAIGYFFSYRTTLLTCDQKAFRLTKLNTVSRYVITLLQIAVLRVFGSYTLYLLVDIVLRLAVQIYCAVLVGREYPYLRDKAVRPLEKEERGAITQNVKALMIHTLGQISITQTDNIITSAFISLEMVGIASNYVMLTTYAGNFVSMIVNSAVASFGNLIVKEDKHVQLRVYQNFRFVSHWLNGWLAVGFSLLATRLLTLLFGASYALPQAAVLLMAASLFLRGELNPMMAFRTAAGAFDKDKYLALAESIINLAVSIIAVQYLGITGVYLGTVVSALFTLVARWRVLYGYLFEGGSRALLSGTLRWVGGTAAAFGLCLLLSQTLCAANTWASFAGLMLGCVLIPNLVYLLLNAGKPEFLYYRSLLQGLLHRH